MGLFICDIGPPANPVSMAVPPYNPFAPQNPNALLDIFDFFAPEVILKYWDRKVLVNLASKTNMRDGKVIVEMSPEKVSIVNSQGCCLVNFKTNNVNNLSSVIVQCSFGGDNYDSMLVISKDRSGLKIFNESLKTGVHGSRALVNYSFVKWISKDSFAYVDGDAMYHCKVGQQPEMMFAFIPQCPIVDYEVDFKNNKYYLLISPQTTLGYQLLTYSKDEETKILDNVTGFTMMKEMEGDLVVSYNPVILKNELKILNTDLECTVDGPFVNVHYSSKYRLIYLLDGKGTCKVIDPTSMSCILTETVTVGQLEKSFMVDDELYILDSDSNLAHLKIKVDPVLCFYMDKKNQKAVHLWRSIINQDCLSSTQLSHCINPCDTPLKRYKRDLFGGAVYAFVPVLRKKYPLLVKNVIERAEKFTPTEHDIINQLISFMIYGGGDVTITHDNILEWIFIVQQCGNEFNKLKMDLVSIFKKTLSIENVSTILSSIQSNFIPRDCSNTGNSTLLKLVHECSFYLLTNNELPGDTQSLDTNDTDLFSTTLNAPACNTKCLKEEEGDTTIFAFGKEYKIHRTVIATFSPVLEVMLDEEGSFGECAQQKLLTIEDTSEDLSEMDLKSKAFSWLILLCYDATSTYSWDLLCDKQENELIQLIAIYDMVDMYQMPFKKPIVQCISSALQIDTFLQVWKWSENYQTESDQVLCNTMLEYGTRNLDQILTHYSEEELSANGLLLVRLLKDMARNYSMIYPQKVVKDDPFFF